MPSADLVKKEVAPGDLKNESLTPMQHVTAFMYYANLKMRVGGGIAVGGVGQRFFGSQAPELVVI